MRSAEAGAGLALARWSLATTEVQSGRPVIASRHLTPFVRGYYFVCPMKLRGLTKVSAFLDWIMAQAATHPVPGTATRVAS